MLVLTEERTTDRNLDHVDNIGNESNIISTYLIQIITGLNSRQPLYVEFLHVKVRFMLMHALHELCPT